MSKKRICLLLAGICFALVAAMASVAAHAQSYTVALTWQAPVSSIDPVVSYNVKRRLGGVFVTINTSPVTTLAYTDTNVVNNTEYFYVVTSVDAEGVESVISNTAAAIIPCAGTNQPCPATGLTTTVNP